MDGEDGMRQNIASFEKVGLISKSDQPSDHDEEKRTEKSRNILIFTNPNIAFAENFDDSDDRDNDSISNDEERFSLAKKCQDTPPEEQQPTNSMFSIETTVDSILHITWFPDTGVSLRGIPFVEGSFTTKLLKFIFWTFMLTALIHVIVAQLFTDRNKNLQLWHIWVFDGDLMVRDAIVFFLVGRLWEKKGIDHLAFVGTALLANIYFESQNYFSFLQHSLTLYQMHCVWPWTLWLFVLILIPSIGALVGAHVLRAYREGTLLIKLMELSLCFFFFVAPLVPSNYFHLHHWYAGWLLGMHANFDVWWSRCAMAWCWGMYVNGIAV